MSLSFVCLSVFLLLIFFFVVVVVVVVLFFVEFFFPLAQYCEKLFFIFRMLKLSSVM